MRPHSFPLFAAILLVAGLAFAEEWKLLNNDQITSALTEKEIIYKNQGNSTQTFYKNGETGFVEGRPSLGYWRVQNNQYCSQWPPSSAWVCYNVYLHTDGAIVRFRGSDGVNWDGTYR